MMGNTAVRGTATSTPTTTSPATAPPVCSAASDMVFAHHTKVVREIRENGTEKCRLLNSDKSSDILSCGVPLKALESSPRLEQYQKLVYAVGPWLWACEVGFLGPLPLRGPIRYLVGMDRRDKEGVHVVRSTCSSWKLETYRGTTYV